MKINFLNICLLILRRVNSTRSKEPPVMTNRKELKKMQLEKNGKINYLGLENNRGRFDKKRAIELLILKKLSNLPGLLTCSA